MYIHFLGSKLVLLHGLRTVYNPTRNRPTWYTPKLQALLFLLHAVSQAAITTMRHHCISHENLALETHYLYFGTVHDPIPISLPILLPGHLPFSEPERDNII